jgi:pyrroline-5-carboxylate reductase
MGSALLKGMMAAREEGWKLAVISRNPQKTQALTEGITSGSDVRIFRSCAELEADYRPDVIIFAVKPKDIESTAQEYLRFITSNTLVVSVIAGKTIASLQGYVLDKSQKIIRAMPNTPASVSMGITALCAAADVAENEKNIADHIFTAVGKTVWIPESQFDLATALSGSGPGMLFAIIEAYVSAAQALGMEEKAAEVLAIETFIGSAALLSSAKTPDQPLSSATLKKLRGAVTSPNGTTEAALNSFKEQKIENLFYKALQSGMLRAKELS